LRMVTSSISRRTILLRSRLGNESFCQMAVRIGEDKMIYQVIKQYAAYRDP
jgi:hypothetical protein